MTVSQSPADDRALVSPSPLHTDLTGDDDADDPSDFYGNPVSPAVARYQFDGTGTPYELHSPQTEVPHLKPPRS